MTTRINYRTRRCINCVFCATRDQYCSFNDTDLGRGYMMAETRCTGHKFEDELEDEDCDDDDYNED